MKALAILLMVVFLIGCDPAPIEPTVLFKFSGDIQGSSETFTGELISAGHGVMDVKMLISNGDTCAGKIKGGMVNIDNSKYSSQPLISCIGSVPRDFLLNLERRGDVWSMSGSGDVNNEHFAHVKVEYLGRVASD